MWSAANTHCIDMNFSNISLFIENRKFLAYWRFNLKCIIQIFQVRFKLIMQQYYFLFPKLKRSNTNALKKRQRLYLKIELIHSHLNMEFIQITWMSLIFSNTKEFLYKLSVVIFIKYIFSFFAQLMVTYCDLIMALEMVKIR